MDFDFDFDAPFGILGDVLTKFRSGGPTADAVIDLIAFDIVDLIEHPQWQELVSELENIVETVSIDDKLAELLSILFVRFLKSLDPPFQKEDVLKVTAAFLFKRLTNKCADEGGIYENSSVSQTVNDVVNDANILVRIKLLSAFMEAIAVLAKGSNGVSCDSVFCCLLLFLKADMFQNDGAALITIPMLWQPLLNLILSFRKTSAFIAFEETQFFPFLLDISNKMTKITNPIYLYDWLNLLLVIYGTNPKHFSKFNNRSNTHESGVTIDIIPISACLKVRRIPILNKLFTIDPNGVSVSAIVDDHPGGTGKEDLGKEIPAWLSYKFSEFKWSEATEMLTLSSQFSVYRLMLSYFQVESVCRLLIETLFLAFPLSSTEPDKDLVLKAVCAFHSLVTAITAYDQELTFLEESKESLLLIIERIHLLDPNSSLSVQVLVNISQFIILFSEKYLRDGKITRLCLHALVHILDNLLLKTIPIITEKDSCLVLELLTMIMKLFGRRDTHDQRIIIGSSCVQITAGIVNNYCSSSTQIQGASWSVLVNLLLLAETTEFYHDFEACRKPLWPKTINDHRIVDSSNDDSFITDEESFLWSMRQLAFGLLYIRGNQIPSLDIKEICDCFPELKSGRMWVSSLFFDTSEFERFPNCFCYDIDQWQILKRKVDCVVPFSHKEAEFVQYFDFISIGEPAFKFFEMLGDKSLLIDDVQFLSALPPLAVLVQLPHLEYLSRSSLPITVGLGNQASIPLVTLHVTKLLHICNLSHVLAVFESSLVPVEIIVADFIRNNYLPYFDINHAVALAAVAKVKGWLRTNVLFSASILHVLSFRFRLAKVKGAESGLRKLSTFRLNLDELIDSLKIFCDEEKLLFFNSLEDL